MLFEPIGERVIVDFLEKPETEDGIYIPADVNTEELQQGRVIKSGSYSSNIVVGDIILFSRQAAKHFKFYSDNEVDQGYVLNMKDIYAVRKLE